MKKLKSKMIYLGLNPKKEFLIVFIVDLIFLLAAVLTFVFLKQILYLTSFLAVVFIFDLLFLTRYSKQISSKNTENLQEFAILFGYFRIYIHNGFSVYSALKEIVSFANPTLKNDLQELISEIDSDKTVQPFIKFGKKFKTMKGVSATNSTGCDATKQVKASTYYYSNFVNQYVWVKNVNTKLPGRYKIVYSITDEIGHSAKKTSSVTVKKKEV